MNQTIHLENPYEELRSLLAADCGQCSGLCCVALYFSKSEGFPKDKKPGQPCDHLMHDFRCHIHGELQGRGLKGCMAYDCFGAGQKVTQIIYGGRTWKHVPPQKAEEIFETFLKVYQMHQLLWYLTEAAALTAAQQQKNELKGLILKNQTMTGSGPEELRAFDIEEYRSSANRVLQDVSCYVRQAARQGPQERQDHIGKDFQKKDLRGKDFSMAFLIAADLSDCKLAGTNFLGTDLRDADLSGADLRESIFLTQMQINETKGDRRTKLPGWIKRPEHWME